MIYWVVYPILLTFTVLTLVTIPLYVLDKAVQPVQLDGAIMNERLWVKITEVSPVVGVRENVVAQDVRRASALSISQKQFGYQVSVEPKNGEKVGFVGNANFYTCALPVANLSFVQFTQRRQKFYKGVPAGVTVDQIFARSYDGEQKGC